MSPEFFQKALSTFEEYNITNEQIDTLKACVHGDLTPAEVARRITRYPEASPTPVEMKLRINGLWTLLNDTAVLLPLSQPYIISILQSTRTLPEAEEPEGEGEGCIDLDDGFYWRELVDWASNWSDSFNSYAAGATMHTSSLSDEELALVKSDGQMPALMQLVL